MKPIYLVAKYVPDVMRMEPRNVGVILWSHGEAVLRFVGARITDDGIHEDNRSLRGWCDSPDVYWQWVEYWRDTTLSAKGAGESKDFIAALTKANKAAGNFWMLEGGFLLDDPDSAGLEAAADQLFAMLVDSRHMDHSPGVAESHAGGVTFERHCHTILKQAQLTQLPGFKQNEEVRCNYADKMPVTFNFSYTVHNGSLKSVMQRIPYSENERTLEKSVNDAALKIEKVVANGMVDKKNAIVIIDSASAFNASGKGRDSLRLLDYLANTVDISDGKRAVGEFTRIRKEVAPDL